MAGRTQTYMASMDGCAVGIGMHHLVPLQEYSTAMLVSCPIAGRPSDHRLLERPEIDALEAAMLRDCNDCMQPG